MCVRTKLFVVASKSYIMDGLDSLTVVELKQLLKEKGLPVSGKKAELIARLEPKEDFIHLYDENEDEEEKVPEVKKPSGGKIEMDCPSCDTRIRVPSDYSGKVKCPVCDHSFDASEIETPSTPFSSPLMRLRGGLAEGEIFRWSHYWLGFFSPFFLLWLMSTMIQRMRPDLFVSLASISIIFGIGLSIYGHATRNRALKFGTLTGLVVVPLIFIIYCAATFSIDY